MKKFQYGKQCIEDDDIQEVLKVLKGELITQGPKVLEFEEKIGKYCDTKYAVAFCNGTAALHTAYKVAELKQGDEIITTPNTFLSTANAGEFLGGKMVFVDINSATHNIDEEKISDKITSKTKIIAPVSYSGYPVDIKKIRKKIRNDIVIIEDAAHALGAERNGLKVGKEADMTMFSFHPIKHITTGEGGMIVTDNKEYYERLKLFRNHGMVKNRQLAEEKGAWYYEMEELGYNYRLTDIQAALGISQLRKLDRFVKRRREIAKMYDMAFKNNEKVKTPPNTEFSKNSYHLYPILVENRDTLFYELRKENIFCQVNYIPIHLQPYYKRKYGYKKGDFPNSEEFYRKEISLPMYPTLKNSEISYLTQIIIEKISELC